MELQDELHCRDREISRLTQERLALIKDAREGRVLYSLFHSFLAARISLLLCNFVDRKQQYHHINTLIFCNIFVYDYLKTLLKYN